YQMRMITQPNGSILEDRIVTTPGSYTATAPLQSGNWAMQVVAFRAGPPPPPDVNPPTISVTAPANGATVVGTVTFSATAADAETGVGGVQFQVDGVNVGQPVTTAPYSLSFNSAQLANGGHGIGAYAWDGARNVGTATPVPVTFSNSSPGNPAQTG